MPSRSNASRVFHRSLGHDYPEAVSGRGCWIYDGAGRAYLDASGGAAVSCLGHGDRRVAQAIRQQLDRLAYTHTSFFTTGVAEELADRLSAAAPGGPWRVLFVSGGSEATEAALKLARQIQVERGQASRDHFVSRHFSYHGNTLGALSVGGHIGRRKLYGPILAPNVRHIPPKPTGCAWRGPLPTSLTSSAPTGSSVSSPRRWSVPPLAPSRPPLDISGRSARSAIAMAC